MKDLKAIVEGIGNERPLLIAGPCSAESRRQVMDAAEALAGFGSEGTDGSRVKVDVFRAGVWKPRTQPGSFEGIGIKALDWLREVKEKTGLPVATEVATPAHVEACIEAGIDILWIGARTSANPFAVQELSNALRGVGDSVAVLVKNPVSPDLELWIGALRRIYNAGVRRLGAIHRGFSSYDPAPYRNRPMWQIPTTLKIMLPEMPLIADPSHIGGSRDLIAPLSQRALSMGFDGLMIETHPNPDEALSDARQQLTPEVLKQILRDIKPRHKSSTDSRLEILRSEIDEIDCEILRALSRRMEVSRKIGALKNEKGMPVLQPTRYNDILKSRIAEAESLGINPDMMRKILLAIHDESVRQQIELRNDN
ncbi:MAG: bifunctional 3-deoxy-7-phosphoheptulonate synthase/chorismate mutase type II [Bacteroides sp.]|nr:bifunctional 3-deoxy-7-phosphoheptulonate synthase/chorismate mutase type II [Bacteroides sp.]